MAGRQKSRERAQVFTYRASDESGRVISGTADAGSREEVVRKLKERGYHVETVEGDQRTPAEREAVTREAGAAETVKAVTRAITVALEEALKAEARAIRAEAKPGQMQMRVLFLIGEQWHEVMSMPAYVWPPYRSRVAELAQVKLRYGVTPTPGRLRHRAEQGEAEFAVTIRRNQVLLERT